MSLLTQWEKYVQNMLYSFSQQNKRNIITMQLTDNFIVSHHASLPVTWPYLHVTLASCHIYLETTSKPNCQFHPVPIGFFYCSKQWQLPGTGQNQRSLGSWVWSQRLGFEVITYQVHSNACSESTFLIFPLKFFLFTIFFFSLGWYSASPVFFWLCPFSLPLTNPTHQEQHHSKLLGEGAKNMGAQDEAPWQGSRGLSLVAAPEFFEGALGGKCISEGAKSKNLPKRADLCHSFSSNRSGGGWGGGASNQERLMPPHAPLMLPLPKFPWWEGVAFWGQQCVKPPKIFTFFSFSFLYFFLPFLSFILSSFSEGISPCPP